MNYLLALALTLVLSACSRPPSPATLTPTPAGGTDLGDASDWIATGERSHWFPKRGSTPVEYCVEVDPAFGKPRQEVLALIRRAFSEWEDYIIRKKLPRSLLSFTAVYVEHCSEQVPLRFSLGTNEQSLLPPNSLQKFPFALALFHSKPQRGGRIWMARHEQYGTSLPDWGSDQFIYTELLHEIGHIYGNEHIPHTVMRENLASDLSTLPATYLGQIDHAMELAPCYACAWTCVTKEIPTPDLRFLSESFTSPAVLSLTRMPPPSPLSTLPFNAFSISIPQWGPSTLVSLRNDSREESFSSEGAELLISSKTGHDAFHVSVDGYRWSQPTVARSYLVNLTSASSGKKIQAELKPRSANHLEFRIPEWDALVADCPLSQIP